MIRESLRTNGLRAKFCLELKVSCLVFKVRQFTLGDPLSAQVYNIAGNNKQSGKPDEFLEGSLHWRNWFPFCGLVNVLVIPCPKELSLYVLFIFKIQILCVLKSNNNNTRKRNRRLWFSVLAKSSSYIPSKYIFKYAFGPVKLPGSFEKQVKGVQNNTALQNWWLQVRSGISSGSTWLLGA